MLLLYILTIVSIVLIVYILAFPEHATKTYVRYSLWEQEFIKKLKGGKHG